MVDTRKARKRCRCHPRDAYGGNAECPRCHHWSLDPWVDMCERRKCGYVKRPPDTPDADYYIKEQDDE